MSRHLRPSGLLSTFLFLVSLFVAAHGQSFGTNGPVLDPCAPITPVQTGDSFTLGLLLWPGQDAAAVNTWIANFQATVPNFQGFCATNVTKFLAGQNVLPNTSPLAAAYQPRWAVFSTRVDRMQLLQVPYSSIVLPMTDVTPPTMVVVVYRANIYSDAVYAASANASLTYGSEQPSQGGVGFAQTLSLMPNFDTGTLTYLQWWGTNCDACGGVTSNLCIKQPINANVKTCVTALNNCTCAGIGVPDYACDYNNANFTQCNTGIQISWVGTDSKSAAFKTGPQIQRLNSLSIVSLYFTVYDYLSSLYSQTVDQIQNSWTNITAGSKQQSVDQGNSVIG